MPIVVSMELNLCNKCIQMTNHAKIQKSYPEKKTIWECLKCSKRSYKEILKYEL